MTPQENIIIRRSFVDTDPIFVTLKVSNNNVLEVVSNTANVSMLVDANTVLSGISIDNNGGYKFNFANVETSKTSVSFNIKVEEDSIQYIIAKGTINFI